MLKLLPAHAKVRLLLHYSHKRGQSAALESRRQTTWRKEIVALIALGYGWLTTVSRKMNLSEVFAGSIPANKRPELSNTPDITEREQLLDSSTSPERIFNVG